MTEEKYQRAMQLKHDISYVSREYETLKQTGNIFKPTCGGGQDDSLKAINDKLASSAKSMLSKRLKELEKEFNKL